MQPVRVDRRPRACRDAEGGGAPREPGAAADAVLDGAVKELTAVLGTSVYSDDRRNLEVVVGDLLRARQLTIAVAESCTGGLLMSRLTDVPGS